MDTIEKKDGKRLLLKRNGSVDAPIVVSNKKAAYDGIIAKLTGTDLQYGEPIIYSYKITEIGDESILLGIKGVTGYQIFEGASHNNDGDVIIPAYIQDAIDTKVNSLVAAMASESGKFMTGVNKKDDGTFEAVKGELISSDKTIKVNGFDLGVNVDGTTIKTDATTGVLSVAAEALTQYKGVDAIEVADSETEGEKKISLKIDAADKVLSQSITGLKANITLNTKVVTITEAEGTKDTEGYKPAVTRKDIVLYGNDNVELGSIDTTDFVVDGMLESVKFSEEEGKENILVFTFNTDSGHDVIEVDLAKYIDTYKSGNGIEVSEAVKDEKTISIKVKEEEKYLEVTADGLATKGLDELVAVEDAAEDGKFVTNIKKTAEGKLTTDKVNITADKVQLAEVADTTAPDVKLEATNVQAGIQELFEKVIDDEQVTAASINKLIEVLGTSAKGENDSVAYTPSSEEIIASATSFTSADELLAAAIKQLKDDSNFIDCGTY